MPYNFVAEVFTERKFVADLLQKITILHGKRPFCVIEPNLGVGLRGNVR